MVELFSACSATYFVRKPTDIFEYSISIIYHKKENSVNKLMADQTVEDILNSYTEENIINANNEYKQRSTDTNDFILEHVTSLTPNELIGASLECYSRYEKTFEKYLAQKDEHDKQRSVYMMRMLASCMHYAGVFAAIRS
jgi:hypothetical protein